VANRITDAGAIEARLLVLAHTTDAKITAAALAYFAPCSLDDASRVLDDLAARDRLSMEIEDDGTIVYQLPGRQKLAPPLASHGAPQTQLQPAPEHGPWLRRQTALVPFARSQREASPLLAAVLGVLVPGAGHLYAGKIGAALLWFFVVSLGYALIFPGLFLHMVSTVSAASAAHRQNGPRPPRMLAAGA
jgi:hypothetical protein